jgi:hypothetical protein
MVNSIRGPLTPALIKKTPAGASQRVFESDLVMAGPSRLPTLQSHEGQGDETQTNQEHTR